MSASPSGHSNGPTPNGGPPLPSQFMRRKAKPVDPLVARKKKPVRAAPLLKIKEAQPLSVRNVKPAPPPRSERAEIEANIRKANGGWSDTPEPGTYHDFPLVTTKRALMDGLRYHVARFAAKKDIDPRDQEEFTRPISLHRRDPRQPVKGAEDTVMADEILDSKEQERQEIVKAEKEARRAADLAQIAPTGKSASAIAAKKSQAFRQEKTSQVFRLDRTAAEKKESDLRYEEALPWHLEDADNKNTWVGTYEAALSDINVAFVAEGNYFRMVPLEKWYKFNQKNQFKGFTIEEAEARFSKKDKESRWVMKTKDAQESERAVAESRRQMGKLYTVKTESVSFKNANKKEFEDADELDFDEDDLFQDDDEMATVEPDKDEEAKESKDRIKRDQLGANIFDLAIEAEIDKELEEEELEEEKRRKLGKGVKKALTKREKMTIYESDSSNPYASSSEDDTSDEEKQAEIDKRKDEEAKAKAKAAELSKIPSGASSKGTNTPSGRPKHFDPLKSKSLKRSGSPNLSESSGNESSRKKHKKKHSSHGARSGSSTPIPGSRPMSPAPSAPGAGSTSSRKSSVIKLSVPPSKLSEIQSVEPSPTTQGPSMSDGEATAGEMSDGGRKKKIKLSAKESLTNSRAGSPTGGSRAGTPAPKPSATPLTGPPVRPEEVKAAIPREGTTTKEIVKLFRQRLGEGPNLTPQKQFIAWVKQYTRVEGEKENKRLFPKPE